MRTKLVRGTAPSTQGRSGSRRTVRVIRFDMLLFVATIGIGVHCRSRKLTCDMASLGVNVAMVMVTDELNAAALNKRCVCDTA